MNFHVELRYNINLQQSVNLLATLPLNAENTFMIFKERRPFKFKKNVHRNKRKP
jgi:hypothetical protein